MRKISKLVFLLMLALSVGAFGVMDADAARAKKSKAELDKAKKAGDQSLESAKKAREAFGLESEEANIESTTRILKKKQSGASTYGVTGFDYLTGVGKVASSPDRMGAKFGDGKLTSKIDSPLKKLMSKRYKNKWTGQLGDTASGWGEKAGVTEVWMRGKKGAKLGAGYNEWVNQWNDITRPTTNGMTLVTGADPDQGAHWFSFFCIHCHGWGAKGDGPTAAPLDPRPRNLTNGKYANYVSNLDMFAVIKGGGAARNLSEAMPPWGNVLQDQDIWNVVAFIRSLPQKEKFVADASDVTAANAGKSEEFKDLNEELELMMAGRGGKQVGGYSSIGGGRLASQKTGIDGVKTSGHGGGSFNDGDWSMDKK
jgi:mono/diheme cytochrome c family protein